MINIYYYHAFQKILKKLENKNLYIYYHFILENNGNDIEERYGVWANGILTETPSKNYFMSQRFTLLENKEI